MLCGEAAGGSREDSQGGAALVFSQIPVLLEAFGLPSQDIRGRDGRSASSLLSLLCHASCLISRSLGE